MQSQVDKLQNKSYGMDQIDLTPALALADAWRGTNMTQSYQRPDERVKDQAQVEKLRESMSKQKNEITDDMIKLLKDKSDGANLRLMMDNARQKRFDESLGLKKEDNIRKDVNKIADEFQTTQGQLSVAENAVREGDTRTVSMIISSIARNVGEQKGALSDGDVARSLPPDIATNVAQLEAFLGRTAKISPELQAKLLQLIQNSRAKSQAIYGESMNRRKAQYSSGAYADIMQPGAAGDVIFSEVMRPTQQIQAPPPPPQMSPEDRLKFLKAKKAGM
jgi:hypothetical protein